MGRNNGLMALGSGLEVSPYVKSISLFSFLLLQAEETREKVRSVGIYERVNGVTNSSTC